MAKKSLHQTPSQRGPYQPDFVVESDLDYTTPYPCGVCGRSFTSRTALATHPHRKATRR